MSNSQWDEIYLSMLKDRDFSRFAREFLYIPFSEKTEVPEEKFPEEKVLKRNITAMDLLKEG